MLLKSGTAFVYTGSIRWNRKNFNRSWRRPDWHRPPSTGRHLRIIVVKTEGRQGELKKIYPKDWFAEAPYVLCVCSIPEKCWGRKDHKSFADVDAAIVMDHIILAATALDLGTCWIGAFDSRAAREVLRLDQTWEPVVFTPLGYPREATVNRVRKPLEDLVVYQ